MEIWKDCKGYEGKYQISNEGRVWSVKRQKYLTINEDKRGRLTVYLYAANGKVKHEQVHRLVALAFIPNPNNLPQVNHKDENPKNNCVDNLEWCDAKYNCNYGTRNARIGIAVLCVETGEKFNTVREAARTLNIEHSGISACLNGRQKTAAGYHWEYA